MTAPIVLGIVATQTTVDVQFDQSVFAPTGEPGLGFTLTLNGVSLLPSSASLPAADTVRLTIPLLTEGDTLLVSYTNSGTNLVNGSAVPAASFANHVVTNNSLVVRPLSATIALHGNAQILSLVFAAPVTSVSAFATGLTVTTNAVATPPSHVGAGPDPRELQITLAGPALFTDVIAVAYSGSSDWLANGVAVPAFSLATANGSTNGHPDSAYPLSLVIREQLAPKNGVVVATIGCNINQVDQNLIDEYGPAIIDFGGGPFGVSIGVLGISLPQNLRPIGDGFQLSQNFFVLNYPAQAAAAATDWLNTMTVRIGTALANLRATDQAVDLGTRTIEQV